MFIPATGEPWQQENKLWDRGQINETFLGSGSEFHRDARGERGSPALEHWGSVRGVNCPCQADKENNNQEKSLLVLTQTFLPFLTSECLLLLLLILFLSGCCVSAESFVAQMALW